MDSTGEKIQEATLQQLEAMGAERLSLRKVASDVGITPMAVYHYFKNRAALLEAVVSAEFRKLEQRLVEVAPKGGFEEKLLAVLDVYIGYAIEHPRVFDYLFAQRRATARRYPEDFRARRSPTLNRVADLINEAMQAGKLRRGDVWELAFDVWAHVHGYVMLHRAGRFSLTDKQFRALARQSNKRFIHGLKSHPAARRT